MVAYAVWVVAALVVLEALEGHEVLEEFEDFEGVEDSVEPEDHELLVQWVGPGDLLHHQPFFCFEYIFPHLIIIQYIFSLCFLHSVIIIQISFILFLRPWISLHDM